MARALAIIPARSGSKGLPNKHLLRLGGKTLIERAIESARAATCLTEIMVTTDDPGIAVEADRFCRWVLRRRPDLATDECGMIPVLQDAVRAKAMTEKGHYAYDLIVLLQPTSPFRTGQDIDETVALVTETGADSAQTVVEAAYDPWKMMELAPAGRVHLLNNNHARNDTRRQDHVHYQPSGAVYVTRRDVLMDERLIVGIDHRGLIRPWERSLNINTPWDWRVAEMVLARDFQP